MLEQGSFWKGLFQKIGALGGVVMVVAFGAAGVVAGREHDAKIGAQGAGQVADGGGRDRAK